VVAGNLRLYVVIAAVALYAGALAAPAIIFKPDARSNPKQGECGFAVKDNVSCEAFRFGGSGSIVCQLSEFNKPGKTYVDKGKILDYCKDWDLPVADSYYGYQVLPMGILGIFLGMFAWFANPLMLAAGLLSAFGKRVVAMILSVSSVALGLQSYALDAVPFNEGSMKADNLNFVDHLGPGFYLWMGSLVVLAVYCFLKKRDAEALGD